ncbi:MAG TPA: fibronectin type III domain-containing protein [Nocardioidaceae bacterium]|nr:fibronectin type III domain-containing protein [Nocardioidaceae bacterium]
MSPRRTSFLAALALVGSGLAGVVSIAGSASAAPEDFQERYCTDGGPRPCLISARLNGAPVPAGGPNFRVEMTGKLTIDTNKYFQWAINKVGVVPMQTSDVWKLTFDLGTMDPDYTEAYSGTPDVDRGANRITYTASPVMYTTGCDYNTDWPWVCPETADTSELVLNGEVWDRNDEFIGFDRSQNPQGVNGIFLETAPDGTEYLSSEMVNSHFLADGETVFNGQVRFRLPYRMLRESFNVPNPETMVASSLVGQINSSTANFDIMQDPDGGGVIVDVSNVHFSKKRLVVKRGNITPTRNRITKDVRVSGSKARLVFTKSKPRGAKVTGYTARCSRTGHTVTTQGRFDTIVVAGLTPGKSYKCQVRAKSKAGASRWSRAKTV